MEYSRWERYRTAPKSCVVPVKDRQTMPPTFLQAAVPERQTAAVQGVLSAGYQGLWALCEALGAVPGWHPVEDKKLYKYGTRKIEYFCLRYFTTF